MEQFDISEEVANLVTTVFLLGYIFGVSVFPSSPFVPHVLIVIQPFLAGPGSEMFGRKPLLLIGMSAYTLFILGQVFAPNIQTLLVTRFFSGFFAVGPVTVGGGFIADIWDSRGRGMSTSVFTGMNACL